MARDYWIQHSFRLANEEESTKSDYPYGSGGAVSLKDEYGWITDEGIEVYAKMAARVTRERLLTLRAREMELDRLAARPFWERWLG